MQFFCKKMGDFCVSYLKSESGVYKKEPQSLFKCSGDSFFVGQRLQTNAYGRRGCDRGCGRGRCSLYRCGCAYAPCALQTPPQSCA